MSLQTDYHQQIAPKLQKDLGCSNPHQVPRVEKIVVNVGLGTYLAGSKDTEALERDLNRITGQKVVIKNATKSVSNFKLREGTPNGARVTLRGDNMYYFLERLIHIVFPRLRDFRGFHKKSFDGRGNYSLGIKEHLIFPEIPTDEVIKPFGLQITITTSAKNNAEGEALLTEFGFPFKK